MSVLKPFRISEPFHRKMAWVWMTCVTSGALQHMSDGSRKGYAARHTLPSSITRLKKVPAENIDFRVRLTATNWKPG